MSSDSEEDYGSQQNFGDEDGNGSDIGEMVAEYEVDEHGNPLNAKPLNRDGAKSKKTEPK